MGDKYTYLFALETVFPAFISPGAFPVFSTFHTSSPHPSISMVWNDTVSLRPRLPVIVLAGVVAKGKALLGR